MKIFMNVVLVVLMFLAISSGVTKIMLMQQEVEFFGPYGFSDPLLMTFGAIQILGGILLTFLRTRVAGAMLVAITFLISLVLLLMAENFPIAFITLIFIVLLGLIIKRSLTAKSVALEN